MDIDELILQQSLLLKSQMCRTACQMNLLATMPNEEPKLKAATAVVEAAKQFAEAVEYIVADLQ